MERRSTFRFRLPWSQSEPEPASKSSPQPSTRTTGSNRPTRQVTRSRTTLQPSSSTRPKTRPSSSPTTESSTPTTATSEKPSSPAQPAAGSQGRKVSASTNTPPPRSPQPQPQNSAETKTPSQSTTTSTSALPETVTTPPQPSSEVKAPIQSSTTNAPASPKSETQTPPSIVSQRPQSSPPEVVPSRTNSQPLIPSQDEQAITSQSASQSDVATKSNVSKPSAPQSQEMNPKSPPTRDGPQVLSTDQLTPKEARLVSQTSSNLPSGITSQEQLKDQTISQPPTPPKQSQESSETSSKSDEKLPSLSGKEPMPTTAWPQSEQVELLKKEAISDTTPEAKYRSVEKVAQPSELSEVKSTRGITEEPSKISGSSEPKTSRALETNIPETKEVKEVVQETADKNYSAGEKIGGFPTSKEQPDIVFQSKQANSDNDQIQVNRVTNGKQTRTSAEHDIPHEVKDNISKFIHRMAIGDNKKILEEGPVSVITLAGDNRGASMQLGSNSLKKGKAVHIHRGYKLNTDESADATTDAEGRQPNDARTMKDQELEAYMNCNVQGLNNSITFDSSIEAKSPGIHMSIPRMSSEAIRSSEGTVLTEAHKAEYNVTRAQKHTYEPTIRRRCLDDLFFEPSDSDSDNHEKPQRHGCHVGSLEKNDNDIDIL